MPINHQQKANQKQQLIAPPIPQGNFLAIPPNPYQQAAKHQQQQKMGQQIESSNLPYGSAFFDELAVENPAGSAAQAGSMQSP